MAPWSSEARKEERKEAYRLFQEDSGEVCRVFLFCVFTEGLLGQFRAF